MHQGAKNMSIHILPSAGDQSVSNIGSQYGIITINDIVACPAYFFNMFIIKKELKKKLIEIRMRKCIINRALFKSEYSCTESVDVACLEI